MKKFAAAALALPLLAHAQSPIPTDPKSAVACYQGIAATSSKADVLAALSCLKDNPFAGEATLADFAKVPQPVPDEDTRAALADVAAQKAQRLYLAIRSRGSDRVLVVDKAWLGGERPAPVLDLTPLRISFTHTSSIFGKEKRVPLQEVAGFSYQEARTRGIGRFVTSLRDKTQVTDDSYQGHYPLKTIDRNDDSKWAAVLALGGTSYQVSPVSKNTGDRVSFKQEDMNATQVTFVSENDAKQFIALFDQKQKEEQAARDKKAEAQRAEAQLAMQKKAQALAEMAKVARGSEDSCKRTDLGRSILTYDPESVEINCQFGGVVELSGLKSAGWLVVNKTKDKDGVVTEYYIRKAR
ncbi:hypothetical protein [Pseudoduganella sp.]|uniref:hypothetical protein n=1 Tax=Pseudoduganella sp. TaxID=1880898 RepID=UPI0035B09E38